MGNAMLSAFVTNSTNGAEGAGRADKNRSERTVVPPLSRTDSQPALMSLIRSVTGRPGAALFPLILVAFTAILAACTPSHDQSTFDAAGPIARTQADLFIFIFWMAVAVFILVEGALVYSVFRYRWRRNGDNKIPRQVHGNTRLEITWTIIPAFVLLAIAVPTVKAIYDHAEPPTDRGEPLEIIAIGHQWWFEFRYPSLEIVTANELHIPTDRPIVVTLQSQDVIHSFWIPKLAGKLDMVPLNDNQFWFLAERTGMFYGQCAEFCGVAHAHMRFRVFASPEDEFKDWVTAMRTPPDEPEPGSPAAAGKTTFLANCSMCHTIDSYRAGGYGDDIAAQDARWASFVEQAEESPLVSGPNLTHLATRNTLAAGVIPLNDENLRTWIKNPNSIKQGTRMQANAAVYDTRNSHVGLTDQEVDNLVTYLLSLEPGEGGPAQPIPPSETGEPDAARGEALFAANGCAGCHSLGDDMLVGPGLQGIGERAATRVPGQSADEYLYQSIREPGAFAPEGYTAGVMLNFPSLTDGDIADLIEYLKTLE